MRPHSRVVPPQPRRRAARRAARSPRCSPRARRRSRRRSAAAARRAAAAAGSAARSTAPQLQAGARRRLLRARPDGRRARGAQRGGQARPQQRADLQRLRARLRDAGRERRRPRRISGARWRSRRTTPRSARTGAGILCQTRTRARVDRRVRGGGAQPALPDALDRADQRRQVQRGGPATSPAPQTYYRRALTVSPNNPEAAYNFALLQYKAAQLRRRARADAHRHAAGQPAAGSAVSRRCAPSASSATASPSCRT